MLAVDPGPHVGLAYTIDEPPYYRVLMYHNIEWFVYQEIYRLKPEVLIVEKFVVVPGARVSHDGVKTIEIVGGCIAVGTLVKAKIIEHRGMDMAKPQVLKAREMLKTTRHTEHHVDALTHLLVYQDRVERGIYT